MISLMEFAVVQVAVEETGFERDRLDERPLTGLASGRR
jgi:hypothetical protein